MTETPRGRDLLSSLEIPSQSEEQLGLITKEGIRPKEVDTFNPENVLEQLQRSDRMVMAVDMGGDTLITNVFEVRNRLYPNKYPVVINSRHGEGYLKHLESIAKLSRESNLSVGLSIAGPLDGTKLIGSPNARIFEQELKEKYDSDFKNLFPDASVDNDAVAGLKASAVEAKRRFTEAENVVYIINGSGFGAAVLIGETVYAIEPGHVQATKDLNPYDQDKPCGLFGNQYVCIENVIAGRAGIEDIYVKETGVKLEGQEISKKYQGGDQLSTELYDNSAKGVALVIKGIADSLDLLKHKTDTVIVCHGGVFNVPGYGERVQQITHSYLDVEAPMLFTKDFSDNACLEGAAISAVVMPKT